MGPVQGGALTANAFVGPMYFRLEIAAGGDDFPRGEVVRLYVTHGIRV